MSMDHLIGKRLNLISKSDIRYVGILHEINPEASTIALENVQSFGTEGRRNNPAEEIPASTSIYEYIVFRGSDVKDISIEDQQKENERPDPPPVPNDPAILGSGPRPPPHAPLGAPPPPQNRFQPPPFQQPPYSYYYPLPNQRYGPQGGPPGTFPPGPGFPPMPYGAPPGWYPPPQGFSAPQQFVPPAAPIGPASEQIHSMQQANAPSPIGPTANHNQAPFAQRPTSVEAQVSAPKATSKPATPIVAQGTARPTVQLPVQPLAQATSQSVVQPAAPSSAQAFPPIPPVETKPDVSSVLATPSTTAAATSQPTAIASKPTPTAPRSNRIAPAIPLSTNYVNKVSTPKINGAVQGAAASSSTTSVPIKAPAKIPNIPNVQGAINSSTIDDATQRAKAAVAAAMANLTSQTSGQKKPPSNQIDLAVENLAKKVSDLRTGDAPRGRGSNNRYNSGHRGRGSHREGRNAPAQEVRKVVIPTTDFDFESSNAKFNKVDLVKEAIASGSPLGTPVGGDGSASASNNNALNTESSGTQQPIVETYNKSKSFFDNLSSETRDREDAGGHRLGGREWRGEEQKKNLETFGQGSVDGYRGWRGRRGYRRGGYGGHRGRGNSSRGGRGGYGYGSGNVVGDTRSHGGPGQRQDANQSSQSPAAVGKA